MMHRINRTSFALTAAALCFASLGAVAQTAPGAGWPSKQPIKFIAVFPDRKSVV